MAQETESAAIRRLFEAAAACGDRYHCPPQDELLARAERPDGTPIAAVAFDLMADPDVRSFDRLGSAAYEAALSWAGARVKAGTFEGQAKDRFLEGVRRVLSADSSTFVEPVYTFFAGPIGDAIPESREILTAEAIDPRRSLEDMDLAAKVLQRFMADLSQVRSWLESGDERRQLAGLALLDYMDHRRYPASEELAILKAASARSDLSSLVADGLIDHVKVHEDEAFLPVLQPLTHHSDPEVRERAKSVVAAIAGAAK